MSKSLKLGLGNEVGENTVVFHGGVTTRDAFGRITDLASVWFRNVHHLNPKQTGDLRVLIQGLLEFGFPADNSTVGHLEMAIEKNQIMVALRFPNYIVEEGDDVEKKLAQFWLNSEDSKLLKRILYPQDHVEVRFLKQLNLVEWRIVRAMSMEFVNPELPSFQVFTDVEENLTSDHYEYVEMGDVAYEEWISEVYQNSHEKNKSGELFQQGESIQGETEWARVVSDHDLKQIDNTSRTFKSDTQAESDDNVFAADEGTSESEADASIETELARTVAEATDDESRVFSRNESGSINESGNGNETGSASGTPRERSGANLAEIDVLNEQIRKCKQLLKQKEKQNQKMSMEISELQKKMSDVVKNAQNADGRQAQLFKDKAMQMFEMVKILQADKQKLERAIFDAKRGNDAGGGASGEQTAKGGPNEAPGLLLQIEELTKKSERLSRALEAEKQKIKVLSDRATSAEREAQGATPLIVDLEKKVEVALKSSQLSKKETEQVKQKLVQSEAEKNKIKNDLIKAQAQIQTLMKRQAA